LSWVLRLAERGVVRSSVPDLIAGFFADLGLTPLELAELRGQARKSATLRAGERAAGLRDLHRRDGQAGQLSCRNPAQWPW